MRSITSVRSRLTRNTNFIPVLTRSFISGVEQGMIGVVFQPFVLSLGASMSQLGFLNSLAGLGGLIPTLVAPWGGWIADQRGRKVVLLGASLAAMGAFAMYGVAGWAASLLLVLPAVILFGISQVYQPVNFALVGESVGQRRRGSAYSLIMLVVTLPGIFVPVLAGMVADRIGFAAVFPAAIALEAIAFVIIWRYLRETRQSQHTEQGWRAILKFLQRAWVPPSEIRWFFIVIGLDLFAYGIGYGLLYGLLRKQYGFSTTELGILSAVSNLTWAVVSLPIGRVLDRTSVKPIMVLSEALGIPMLLIWITQSRLEILAASMTIFAVTAATWIPARNVYITQTIEPARRGEMFGRLSAFSGLLAFPASFIGGFLYDHFGFAAPIAGNLVFSIVTVLVLVFLVQAPQKGEEVWQNAIPTPSE